MQKKPEPPAQSTTPRTYWEIRSYLSEQLCEEIFELLLKMMPEEALPRAQEIWKKYSEAQLTLMQQAREAEDKAKQPQIITPGGRVNH